MPWLLPAAARDTAGMSQQEKVDFLLHLHERLQQAAAQLAKAAAAGQQAGAAAGQQASGAPAIIAGTSAALPASAAWQATAGAAAVGVAGVGFVPAAGAAPGQVSKGEHEAKAIGGDVHGCEDGGLKPQRIQHIQRLRAQGGQEQGRRWTGAECV